MSSVIYIEQLLMSRGSYDRFYIINEFTTSLINSFLYLEYSMKNNLIGTPLDHLFTFLVALDLVFLQKLCVQ